MRRAAAALAFGLAAAPVAAETLVITLSAEEIRIASTFTGTTITVFGAIEDGEGLSGYDIAVALEGPRTETIVRRKDAVVGLWINRAEARFTNVPEFYAIHATAPLADIAAREALGALGLGVDNLALGPTMAAGAAATGFRQAVLRLRREAGRYVEDGGAVERIGSNLFRTTFSLPSDVPDGAYTARALLFRDGALQAEASENLAISKTGGEQFLFDAAHENAWLYALAVILMAASIGWLGGTIFRRD
ncbi:MAG: TIGR02186 family protein [Bauldia sp.]|nr:TIGR02186 family protein [Bauldia sp.]